MAIHQAFFGHGIFAELPDALLTRYTGWKPPASRPPAFSASPAQNPLAATGTAELIQALRWPRRDDRAKCNWPSGDRAPKREL
jgi:hypothetical protein